MKKHFTSILLICLIIFLANLSVGKVETTKVKHIPSIADGVAKHEYMDSEDVKLWASTVRPYLESGLWTDRDSYDAGHYLMVPMHAAFLLDEPMCQEDFTNYFTRFMETVKEHPKELASVDLNQLQHLYLASRFLVLSAQTDNLGNVPEGLPEYIESRLEYYWLQRPAWQWGRKPFIGGMKERVAWKLENEKVNPSYLRAIIDEEFFVFAIAADLQTYKRLTSDGNTEDLLLDDILMTARGVFAKEYLETKRGCLFQPGVWSDHPDYLYAGRMYKYPYMGELKRSNVAMDSSHSHRFPLWFVSLEHAAIDPAEKELYKKLRKGLENQFYEVVLVSPSKEFPAYRLYNYMDGWNGVYRWEYITQGKNKGYGPYELSGTLMLGWWCFLGTDRVSNVYSITASLFPLPEKIIDLYVGPNTTRERHPLVTLPDSYQNGFLELTTRLAGKLPALIN